MKFDYQKFPSTVSSTSAWINKPIIRIRLAHGDKAVMTDALIDSGADTSLFHSSLATKLGIDLKSGIRKDFYGIAGDPVPGYFHPVHLQIVGMNTAVKLLVAFTLAEGVAALLGQADFFQSFQIKFERYNERIEINPARK